MSLQVWLPLTKDLRNQGLADVTITNNGATFNSAGKLGGCYSFPTTGGNLDIPSNAMSSFISSNGCSLAFWIKLNAWNTGYETYFQAGTGSAPWNNYIFGILRNNTASTVCFTIGNGSTVSNANYLTSAWETGVWFHMVFTYETGKCKIYKNGVLDKEYTTSIVPDFSKITKITIGRCNNNSSYQTNCNMNDIRIYNHCLSPMEVKLISQGLVLHYPLNRNGWGQENLLARYVAPGGGGPTSTATAGRTNYYGDYGIIIPATENADTYFRLFMTEQLVSGQTYTISCQASGIVSGTYYTFPMFAQNNTGMGYLTINHNGLCTMTFTMNWTGTQATATGANGETVYINFLDDASRVLASGQGAITLTHFKLEKGSVATPWCPNSSDTLATTMGLNSTIEYDCSGFCNNGTRTGTFSWTSDTPKYAVSTYFASGNNYIDCGASQEVLPTDGLTVSLWVNYSTWGNPISCTEGGGWNFENSSGIQFPVYITGVGYKVANSGVATSTLQNGWHMLTGTFDKANVKIYVDGVLKATTATGSTNGIGYAANHCYVGAEAAGSTSIASAALVGQLSDVRIYATALSADDVKSLYQNCATIDPDGTIRGQIRS